MDPTIMANGEGCVKARTLLQRFTKSPHVRVDNDVEDSTYSLKGVVQWVCSEGMCEEGDVDMTMQQKEGTYTPADFKKLQGTVARNGEMLVDGSKDELKSGAAENLVLSRMKDIVQTPPENFQDVPVVVADGVEYIMLDQLVDFMKKGADDRNIIHEVLHEVTEFALQDEEDEEEDEGASSSDVEVSGSDVSNDEEDEEHDVYYDLKGAGGQVTKGWAHAILRLARAFPDPHKVLRVVMKAATPDGALQYAAKMDSGPRVCDCGRRFMSLRTLNSHHARACPTVADERTHGQEMGVVDDARPSSIGAVNLVSDESEDVGAPENVDGEGGTFEEQQPQPVESFDSSRKLAALIFSARGARGGVGISQSDIDALLSLLTNPRFNTRDIAYRNSRECLTWAGSLAEAAGWKELDLRCDDWPGDAHSILWHRD
ncbi:hypothetical protein CBR_g9059 [Chara braunii]|uniref:Uncharacterized protein n=1 Tax=Chara braunii TaxID=69332 RepID=A0A388KNX4_CHABU|nr:hypothetical protein CBR_g9059 [Chara braunii]|eukprot:GBG71643.1 hypothetical protein CBR_g9059 [Chara braunii]